MRRALPHLTIWFSEEECSILKSLFLFDSKLWKQRWNMIAPSHGLVVKHGGMRHALRPAKFSELEVTSTDELICLRGDGASWRAKDPAWVHPKYPNAEKGDETMVPTAPRLYYVKLKLEWRPKSCLESHLSYFNKIDLESNNFFSLRQFE